MQNNNVIGGNICMQYENRAKETHLGFIQSVITRMGQNSFQVKLLCITMLAGLLAFYTSQDKVVQSMASSIIPPTAIVFFYLMDAYYFYLEKGYRRLYAIVAELDDRGAAIRSYDMDIPKEEKSLGMFFKALCSKATGPFYLVMIFCYLALCCFMPGGR